ncbi:MAG TPA: efflux RND transporter periplasmic adaptor subunit [Steroidobacteraceae bacterium]|nr:efflux RND transporter periplasmic adaptor subunit [Steroidobacteraceae bacterium]
MPHADRAEVHVEAMSSLPPPRAFNSEPTPWFLRRGYLIAAAIVLVGVVALVALTRGGNKVAAQNPADAAPLVTALPAGRSPYTMTVSFTGAIVARYDMPIGVDVDAGRIAAILVEVGDHVRQGQVLARLDTSVIAPQVASLRAALEQNKAEAKLAEADYRRAAAIAGSVGALSKEEVDKRQSTVATSAARVKAAEAQLAEAEARLGRTAIRAPADGVVLTRTAEVGQAVMPGSGPLFRLARGGDIEMRAQVAEQDLPRLKVGQTAEVRVTGVATPFTGKLRLLAAVIDPQTRLGEVRVTLPHDPNLRPGAFARGEARVGSDVRPIVPQTALLSDTRGSYVLIVPEDGHVQRREVHVGGAQPTGIVIDRGLDGNERVVTTAGAFLHEGEFVRVAPPRDAT